MKTQKIGTKEVKIKSDENGKAKTKKVKAVKIVGGSSCRNLDFKFKFKCWMNIKSQESDRVFDFREDIEGTGIMKEWS